MRFRFAFVGLGIIAMGLATAAKDGRPVLPLGGEGKTKEVVKAEPELPKDPVKAAQTILERTRSGQIRNRCSSFSNRVRFRNKSATSCCSLFGN